MKVLRRILPCVLLLLASPSLQAQWSGGLELSGGYGWLNKAEEMAGEESGEDVGPEEDPDEPGRQDFMPHALAQAGFRLRYMSPKWTWNTTVDSRWEPKVTDTRRGSLKDKLEYVQKMSGTSPLSLSFRTETSWKPGPDRSYDAWIRYQYRHDEGVNETFNLTMAVDPDAKDNMSYYYEEPSMNEHTLSLGGGTRHELGSSRRALLSSFSVERKINWQHNQWMVLKSDDVQSVLEKPEDMLDMAGWVYKITPRNDNISITARVHVRDSLSRGPVVFVLDPGLRFTSHHDTDLNSGATLDLDELEKSDQIIWRDSLRLRERFDFLSLRIEPYVAGDLTWEKLKIHFDYGLQVYGRRLNNEEHYQGMKMRRAYPVGSGSVNWQVGEKHRLILENTMTVTHPDYFKICWYERTGGYLNQLYRGNEKLLSTSARSYSLGYEFKPGRFRSLTTVSMTRKVNEVDQTWSNQEIEGRLYKVFTWINSADSWTFGASERMEWAGQLLSARLALGYNQTLRTVRETGAVKKSFDWNLSSGATVHLPANWDIGADIRYQSKVATFFSLFNQYCVLNARIQKRFKKFSVYLEGRDLLDNERTTTFESADHKERWVESVRANRRLVILGLNWNF